MLKAKELIKPIHKDNDPDPLFYFQQEDSEEHRRSVLRQNSTIWREIEICLERRK